MNFEYLILTFSYLGIYVLMTINGVVAFPSSQILYILSGYFIFQGDLNFALVVFFGALGHTTGNIILYEISRKKGLEYITSFKIFPKREIEKVEAVFRKRGDWFLILGKLVNPIKVFIPIPAGISKMNRVHFGVIVFVTSVI